MCHFCTPLPQPPRQARPPRFAPPQPAWPPGATSEPDLVSLLISHDTEEEILIHSLPSILRQRILAYYGSHAPKHLAKLKEWEWHNEYANVCPPVMGDRLIWRRFWDRLEWEMGYSVSSQNVSEIWRHQTPNADTIQIVCDRTGWREDFVRELILKYAYPERTCFKCHRTEEPDREHAHRSDIACMLEACEWDDLFDAIQRDYEMLDMLFLGAIDTEREGRFLRDIVRKVESDWFELREEGENEVMRLTKKAKKHTKSFLIRQDVEDEMSRLSSSTSPFKRKMKKLCAILRCRLAFNCNE
ncbi:MAG: hypothetical protein LQ340_004877 [Diploschistes diacapsis]|nr:MAG: hypothetical protein LQ340_004877 [Diploschistes diacapsis]